MEELDALEDKQAVRRRLREAELRLALVRRTMGAPAPKRARTVDPRPPAPASAPAPMAHVTLGSSSYEVLSGGRALRRAAAEPSAPSTVTSATASAAAAASAAAVAATAARRAVASLDVASAMPPPSNPQTRRRVSVPGAGFEPTAGGMGIQRRPTNGHARTRPAEGKTAVDFRRQRRTDEARAAKGQVLCSHFCRYGRCTRSGSECPYEHNPLCVAICQAYLHGQCKAPPPCLLSHEPSPERMPTCRLFHHGLCTAEACEFSHVYLGAGTKLCAAFSRNGYCADGASCANRHEMVCEVYVRDGSCALGERCRLSRRLRAEDRASVHGGSSQL